MIWFSSAGVRSAEDAIALMVDDLLGLGDRKGDGVLPAAVSISPDKAVLLHALGRVLLDASGSLILAIVEIRCRLDPVPLVFDRCGRGGARRRARSPAHEAGPPCFELREHGSRSSWVDRDSCASAPGCPHIPLSPGKDGLLKVGNARGTARQQLT